MAALEEYGILDTPRELAFDDLARLAARTCGVPIALISFVAADRVWLKAHLGVTTTEIPRSDSLCAQAILSPHRFHISDLSADPRYARHPAVTGPEHLRFYAGAPLIAPGGFAVGVLCVLDHEPRTLTADQLEALETIARQVITQLELRRNLRRLERSLAGHERTEAALRRAEARYRSIFENVAEGIFQTTAEGQYLAANPMLARIYGYDSPAELQTAVRNIRGQLYVDPERRAEFTRLMREHGEVHHFESQIRRKDGTVIWISENARSVTDADGRFLYYEGTVEDISDRRQAEEALRNSELLYHSLVDALPQNIFRKDTEGRFTFVNQLFCQTLKRPAPAILGQTDAAFFPPNSPPSTAPMINGSCRASKPSKRPRNTSNPTAPSSTSTSSRLPSATAPVTSSASRASSGMKPSATALRPTSNMNAISSAPCSTTSPTPSTSRTSARSSSAPAAPSPAGSA
ncbi:MAG: PAS domain S-box protein [Verrucomicrobia bacterium]|nr:PAS domain S-box protein [Verrucomicrobiota bacterium]